MGYFFHHSGRLNSPETENDPHMVTGVTEETRQYPHLMTATQEEIPYCLLSTSSGEQKKARSTNLSHNFAVRIPLRQLKQARFCWPFNKWRRTAIEPTSTLTSVESRNCLNPLQRQCPHLIENQKRSNCLKTYSKQV